MSEKKEKPQEYKIRIGERREMSDIDRRLSQIYEVAIRRYHEHNQQKAELETTPDQISEANK